MVVEKHQQDNLLEYADLCSPFIYGDQPVSRWPLQRYLPEIPGGLTSNWIKNKVPPNSILLDPFGNSPALSLELARQGYGVVTCILNPVIRQLLETGTKPFSRTDALSAIDELAQSLKENTRFDQYIQSFYKTRCSSCSKLIQADEYIWERGSRYPSFVIYDCPECGDRNQAPPEKMDMDIVDTISRSPLYRALAIDRITGLDMDLRQDARDVSSSHLPRALYIVVAIFSRLDALVMSQMKKNILETLLLTVLDHANTLWPVESPGYRPRQLSIPTRFKEFNLWKVLENACETVCSTTNHVRVLHFPELPSPGEITIFPGRVRDLLGLKDCGSYDGVVTTIPRPSQAFWKLSVAWSSWILGKKENANYKRIIVRDRYDWSWHANALFNTFQTIKQSQKVKQGIFGLLSETEPPFLSCVLPSARRAGWKLENFALDPEDHITQIHWGNGAQESPPSTNLYRTIEKGAETYLKYKGEPADYLEMTCASLLILEKSNHLIIEQNANSVQTQLKTAFSHPGTFIHLGPGEQTLESGFWWLRSFPANDHSFSDFVELETLRMLNSEDWVTPNQIEKLIREKWPYNFCGIREYIEQLLASYAYPDPGGSGVWKLKEKEINTKRQIEVEKIKGRVKELGDKLQCTVEGDHPITWRDKYFHPIYRFYVYYHTAFFGELVQENLQDSSGVLILPASRLNLLAYKNKENPAMNQLLTRGWYIAKFRLMSRLLENPLFSMDSFSEMLKTDPVENNPDQLFLF